MFPPSAFDWHSARRLYLPQEKSDILRAFQGHVPAVAVCANGNWILARVIEVLPSRNIDFIVREIMDYGRMQNITLSFCGSVALRTQHCKISVLCLLATANMSHKALCLWQSTKKVVAFFNACSSITMANSAKSSNRPHCFCKPASGYRRDQLTDILYGWA